MQFKGCFRLIFSAAQHVPGSCLACELSLQEAGREQQAKSCKVASFSRCVSRADFQLEAI